MEKTETIGFRVSKEQKKQLQDLAKENGTSMSQLIYAIVIDWMKWITDENN